MRGGFVLLRCDAISLLRLEDRSFFDSEAHVEADTDEHDGEQERDSPAVIEECLVGVAENCAGDEERAARENKSNGRAELREHGVEAAFAGRGVFRGEQGCARPFTTDCKSLTEAQEHQDDRSCNTDCVGAGQQTDEQRRNTHQQQSGDERLLATDAISEVPEQHCADRPCDEGNGKGRERRHCAGSGPERRKEDRRKDKRRSGSVDEEVVELNGRADTTGDGNSPHTRCLRGGCRSACGTRSPCGRDCGHSIPPWSGGVALWASPSIRGKVVIRLTPALPPKGGGG